MNFRSHINFLKPFSSRKHRNGLDHIDLWRAPGALVYQKRELLTFVIGEIDNWLIVGIGYYLDNYLPFNKLIPKTWLTNPPDVRVSMFDFMKYCIYIMTLWLWKQIGFCDPIQRALPVSIKFSFDKTVTQSSVVPYCSCENLLSVSLSLSEQWNVWEMCVAFFIWADKSASDFSVDSPWSRHILPSNSFWQKRWQNIQSRWHFCNQHHNLSWEM